MIYYTGDIHGSAKGIVAFAQRYELTESDIIVILGDVGANYYGNRRDRYCKDALAKIKPTVFCIILKNTTSENAHKDGNRKCESVSILVTLKNPSILLFHGKL